MKQPAIKKVAVFVYLIENSTWALIAYLLHKVGVSLRAIAFVLGIGIILGNLAAFTAIKLAAKVLGRSPRHFE